MDVNSIASFASQAASAKVGNQAAIDALVVSKEQQKQTATQLLETVPKPKNPAHLGNNIDVKA